MPFDPWFRNRLIRDAILKATHTRMQEDPTIYILGEGAHMKVHFDSPAIERDFPQRIITLPISEDGNTNFAVGMSLAGLTPIVDVITSDFLFRTMDAVCNTASKQGHVSVPRCMVIRAEFLTGGPTTGQRIESLFAHIPGLNVAVPSNPDDAYNLMSAALRHPGVTILFEDRTIEDRTTQDAMQVASSSNTSSAALYARGQAEVTIVSYGKTLRQAILLQGLCPADIIDLRTLHPLDMDAILDSVRRTGALLVIEPDVQFLGIGAEIVAQVAERVPGCRVKRLGAPRVGIPACRELHGLLLPTDDAILDAVRSLHAPV